MRRITIAGILFSGLLTLNCPAQQPVTLTEVNENIPTYLSGPPDPDPMFYFGQGSQGAEGRIYPYPLYDNLTNRKSDKTYKMVYLENEYVKIGILPEIGGRLFSAVDKTNNYDFIYRQHVIKPALIGLTGAWISGGIEWNIPHHHRASTFIPVQWTTEEKPDGSKTIWVGELEVRHRMRWAVGYTLRPGSSVLECSVRIINRTPLVNTMLCFANVAVAPNDNYQIIFPPSTQWSTGHSKRSFMPWPVSDSVDYSYYRNHKVSGSFFAWNYEDDFVAGYDHGKNAGTMSVTDHNIVPGKKFFTWGVGSPWDKILTDDDGPYLEIMVGAYSDNQPDYSWLQPFEERAFEMSWYPFRGIDGAKNANLDAAVNLEINGGKADVGFYATHKITDALVRVTAGSQILLEEKADLDPSKPWSKQVSIPAGTDNYGVKASLIAGGKEIISYSPVKLQPVPRPVSVANPATPSSIKNDEELFLAGQRIEQFHNPTLDAGPYWEELLKRDPSNVAANTGMGILDLKAARFESAEKYFRKAIERLTFQYTSPKNGEPFYYLGMALREQGKTKEAFSMFYKATWNQEWKAPAYYSLAELACADKNFTDALDYIDRSIDANAMNVRAYGLKSAILRHLGRSDEAIRLLDLAVHKTDPLDVRLMGEKWIITRDPALMKTLTSTLSSFPQTAQELAAEYSNAGLFDDGISILGLIVSLTDNMKPTNAIVLYYVGDMFGKKGDDTKASEFRKLAALQKTDYVFPFQYEVIGVLQRAIKANPADSRAPYYLGNLLFDWQPDEAARQWEKAASLEPGFAITWRNLAQAYSHKAGEENRNKAIEFLEKAIASENPVPTHFAELDRLYKSAGVPVSQRLSVLEKNQALVVRHDEALGDLIGLKTFTGKADEAITFLTTRIFNIWEGGNAFNTGQAWTDAHVVRGLQRYKAKKYREALDDFQVASKPPDNLRAVQNRSIRQLQLNYWIACTYEATGNKAKAKEMWNEIANPTVLNSGNTGNQNRNQLNQLTSGEQKYYAALSNLKLGNREAAERAFKELSETNTRPETSQTDNPGDPQFVAARRLPSRDNAALPHYLAGLGYSGLGDKKKATDEFNAALAESPDFLSAKIALDQL